MRIEQIGNTYYLIKGDKSKALTKNRTKALSIANKYSLIIILN